MAKRLSTNVVLTNLNGGTVTYRMGSTPPDDVAERITNPDAWVDDTEAPVVVEPVVPVIVRPTPPGQPSVDLGAAGAQGTPPPTGDGDPAAGQEPARNGKTEAWKAYAEALGQTVEDDAGRDEIIAQLVAASLIKE
jgi:hypothetical protein